MDAIPYIKKPADFSDGEPDDADGMVSKTEVQLNVSVNTPLTLAQIPAGTYTVTEVLGKDNINVQVDGYLYHSNVISNNPAIVDDASAEVVVTNNYQQITLAKKITSISRKGKTVTELTKAQIGDIITYTVTVTNDMTNTIKTLATPTAEIQICHDLQQRMLL